VALMVFFYYLVYFDVDLLFHVWEDSVLALVRDTGDCSDVVQFEERVHTYDRTRCQSQKEAFDVASFKQLYLFWSFYMWDYSQTDLVVSSLIDVTAC
jgi:hypothetical protein